MIPVVPVIKLGHNIRHSDGFQYAKLQFDLARYLLPSAAPFNHAEI